MLKWNWQIEMLESLNASLVVFIPADDVEGKKWNFFFFKIASQRKNRLHCVIKLKRNSTFQVVESFNIPLVDVSPGAVEDEIGEKRKGKKTFT